MGNQRPLAVVVDGHGGGMGKALVARIKERLPQVHVRAVGTNSDSPKPGAGSTEEALLVLLFPLVTFIQFTV